MNDDQSENAPHVGVTIQYIKDLSFESPAAPKHLTLLTKEKPEISIALDLHVNTLNREQGVYEVVLYTEAKALVEGEVVFILELSYGGVFTVVNFSEEEKEAILAVHCPSLLFPFARKIIAEVSRDAGFQALMIDPVDFGTLYRNKAVDGGIEINDDL